MSFLPPPQSPQGKAWIILITCPWMIGLWQYGLHPAQMQSLLVSLSGQELAAGTGAVVSMLLSVLLLGVFPASLVLWVFRERLADYHFGLGDRLRSVRSFLIALPVVIAGAYFSSLQESAAAGYPLNPDAGKSLGHFAVHAVTYGAFYMAWEFYFRGFMQRGLTPLCGVGPAILVQTMASALAHLGRSPTEMFASILGGLLWGWLSNRTRSVVSGCLQHALLGVGLDAFICLHRAGWWS